MIKKILLLFTICISYFSFAQSPNLSENSTISVLTCGQGSELYSVFGHTAIRINDATSNVDVVFNYGAFDFRTENFYLKFVKGDLQYFIAASSFDDFIYEYEQENREVIEQILNLNLNQKQQLFDKLNASLFSDERTYTYKFIDRNCTTMVAEKINQTTKQGNIKKVDDTTISYRKVLYPYFENHFWYKLGINCIFGYKTDLDATQLFLPIELLHSLDSTKVNGKPLVAQKKLLLNGLPKSTAFSFFNSIYFVIAILLLLILINNKKVIYVYFILFGLLGIFFSLVGFYSFHKEISFNYNVLLFNPILLVLPFVQNKIKWIYTCIFLLVAYLLFMLNKPHLFLVLPFVVTNILLLLRFLREKKLLSSVK